MKPGDAVVTYDCEGVKIGCSICYDLRFPDLFQALADRGAEMIALPAAFTLQTGKDHWEVLLRARAIETQTYVCAGAQTGVFTSAMNSAPPTAIRWSPTPGAMWSRGLGRLPVVSARIDPARVKKVRANIPVARHKVKIARG